MMVLLAAMVVSSGKSSGVMLMRLASYGAKIVEQRPAAGVGVSGQLVFDIHRYIGKTRHIHHGEAAVDLAGGIELAVQECHRAAER